MTRTVSILVALCAFALPGTAGTLPVRVTWGHTGRAAATELVQVHADDGMRIEGLTGTGPIDGAANGSRFVLDYPEVSHSFLQRLEVIWADLIAAADADTAQRLGHDAAMEPGSPRLYVRTRADGTSGFAVTLEQLRRERAIWVPSLDIYITAGEPFVEFGAHQRELESWKGRRVLDQIEREPDASYEQYTARWEDMGSPAYMHPRQPPPGHIICLSWDSSLRKFGVDRGGGVRNDLGNADRFRLWFGFGDIEQGIIGAWKRQSLDDGLPLVTTVIERDGVRYDLEQFAYPLDGPPKERRGDIPMVLMERLRVSSLDGRARRVPVTLSHRRWLDPSLSVDLNVARNGSRVVVSNSTFGQILLEVDGGDGDPVWAGVNDGEERGMHRVDLTLPLDVPAQGSRELIVKLPSPVAGEAAAGTLARLDYEAARRQTVSFWNGWIARGAQFQVPEKVVNDLYRASLWHALRLPRRHGAGPEAHIDLPYSNFAYSQTGTPWPVNQAVYVDYMIYGLRGYQDVAGEELAAQYRNNQERNGHVSGYANWVVYTPGMLYAAAQNFLLSGDRAAFDRVLPQSLKALDWCLDQLRAAELREGPLKGLVFGPLNDLTGDGDWAFSQAYMYAGLDLFGEALHEIGNPRSDEALAAARRLAAAVDRGFRTASARSPLVQLRDHTWIPYVPSNADQPRRLLDDWYPTDVDTGPVHLLRLDAVPPSSDLGDWLLNDNEDNLFYRGWGIANEPVYNQHATVYLARDDAKAVIRTFYSYMASGFSQSALEPVEHRFTHGQYFGPPSTDGAWFELYRNMLIYERGDDSLLLAGYTPRRWLRPGQRIDVSRAPTKFGDISMAIASQPGGKRIEAEIRMQDRRRPKALLVRFRHPAETRMKSVTVNGKAWSDFDPAKEQVRIAAPAERSYSIVVDY